MKRKKNFLFQEQIIPLLLTVVTFLALCLTLLIFIRILNLLPSKEKIQIRPAWQDIAVGLTIYLKTAIDFAIFIGNVMRSNPGWKKRVAIELGTAVGNAFGTLFILLVWNFFREVPLLMAIMIVVASLVLLRMAEESLEEFLRKRKSVTKINKYVSFLAQQLIFINKFFRPFLGKLIPNMTITNIKPLAFWNLAVFSFTIPFILGLDDFAGYIPLFNVINVFGFAIGVFLGHMVLNLGLFISPKRTVALVRNQFVLIAGSLAFIGIAAWGFYEVTRLIIEML